MAELEIHHEHEGGEKDPLGRKIGIVASLLAVCLAIVTIASHRAHTAGVLTKADENDQWSLYQAKKIKLHNLELGVDLAAMLSAKDGVTSDDTQKRVARFQKEILRYNKESDGVQEEAKAMESKVKTLEDRALRYDVGEGLDRDRAGALLPLFHFEEGLLPGDRSGGGRVRNHSGHFRTTDLKAALLFHRF